MKKLAFIICICLLVGCDTQLLFDNVTEIASEENYSYHTSIVVFDKAKALNAVKNEYVANQQGILLENAEKLQELYFSGEISWKCELYITDSVFMANRKYISTRLMEYIFTGGNHGATTFKSYNYDVSNQKLLSNNEIIDMEQRELINTLLRKYFNNKQDCFTTEPSIDENYAINISEEWITFTYEQYILGPYACGYVEVNIPISEAKPFLKIKI